MDSVAVLRSAELSLNSRHTLQANGNDVSSRFEFNESQRSLKKRLEVYILTYATRIEYDDRSRWDAEPRTPTGLPRMEYS